MTVERGGYVEGEHGVAAFGGAVLDYVLPLLLVFVFLSFGPGVARGEIDGVRVGGPGEAVHLFFALSKREGFAAGGRD